MTSDRWFIVYTNSNPVCPYCIKVKELLDVYGFDYHERDISEPEFKSDFLSKGFRTVPQVFVTTKSMQSHIGGYETTKDYLRNNFFDNNPRKDAIIQELRELDVG